VTKPNPAVTVPSLRCTWLGVDGWKFVSMSLEIYGSEFYLAKQANARTDSHTRPCERFGLVVLFLLG
jgi:hypothetical protein